MEWFNDEAIDREALVARLQAAADRLPDVRLEMLVETAEAAAARHGADLRR